ncbi:MAG: hypothetical protein ABI895_17505 [Deltaproteobacteria bacterium]
MKNRILALAILAFLSAGVLGAAQADPPPVVPDEPIQLDTDSCDCPKLTHCGKTAASCSSTCTLPKTAQCDCASTAVPCYGGGPYGSFKNSCRCSS